MMIFQLVFAPNRYSWRAASMKETEPHRFTGLVTAFQDRRLPERASLAGYAALIDAYSLRLPLPRKLSAIGERHRRVDHEAWRILSPRHAPRTSLEGHLTFALKHEGLDLSVL